MNEQIFRDNMLEAVFRQAVIDNFERGLVEIEKEPDVAVSERQQRRMAVLFAKERRHRRTAVVFVWTKRFAAVAASLFILLGCALLTVPEVRASVGGTIVGWFDTFTQFGHEGSSETESAEWRPASLPAGFGEADRTQAGAITSVRYVNTDGDAIEFKYVTNDNTLSTNNEGVEYGQSPHGGIVYHTFAAVSGDYKSAVVWDTAGYLFTVTGYLPMEQLLETAWSVERE
jgi:hypothetical protein